MQSGRQIAVMAITKWVIACSNFRRPCSRLATGPIWNGRTASAGASNYGTCASCSRWCSLAAFAQQPIILQISNFPSGGAENNALQLQSNWSAPGHSKDRQPRRRRVRLLTPASPVVGTSGKASERVVDCHCKPFDRAGANVRQSYPTFRNLCSERRLSGRGLSLKVCGQLVHDTSPT
jgi:hypothetical protein